MKHLPGRTQHTALDDATPLWMEMLIVLVFSPFLIIAALYAGLKWFFTVPFRFNYPRTDEEKRFIMTERYLEECRKHKVMSEWPPEKVDHINTLYKRMRA